MDYYDFKDALKKSRQVKVGVKLNDASRRYVRITKVEAAYISHTHFCDNKDINALVTEYGTLLIG